MYVIPAQGLLVPDPLRQGTPDYFVPTGGREVDASAYSSGYWERRLLDGDITVGSPPPPAPAPAPAP
jgi:hypothetical protein